MKYSPIKLFFLTVLIVLVAINYHAMFFKMHAIEGSNPISPFVIYTTFLVFILTFRAASFLKEKIIRTYIASILIVLLFFILLNPLGNTSSELWIEARTILLSLIFIAIGYCTQLSEKQLIVLCLVYCGVVSFSTMSQIVTNIGGFVIEEINYVEGKNSLGALAACACIVSFAIAFMKRQKFALFYPLLALGLFLLVMVLTIRSRTSAVCIFSFLVVFAIKSRFLKPQHFIYVIAFVVFVLIIANVTGGLSASFDYIYDSFTLNSRGDITSDRTRRNLEAWMIFENNPLLGRMYSGTKIDWVHNYVLRILSDYGLLGSSPMLVLYFVLGINVFKKLKKANINNLFSLGYFAMLVPLITSLAEPTYPYGPGTAVFFSFFLFGVSLSKSSDINYIGQKVSK